MKEIEQKSKKQRELLIQEERSLCFPFYTNCIIIVGQHYEKLRKQCDNGSQPNDGSFGLQRGYQHYL
jgi:hypothetical protein